MNVEDSYEGAVRRLQRLEMAGVAMESSPAHGIAEAAAADDSAERMRELEELATLACEDNERLKREFGAALQELDDTRKQLDGALAEVERARRGVDEAAREIEVLRGQVASLQQLQASPQQAPFQAQAAVAAHPFAAQPQPFASAPSPFADTSLDEDYGYPPKRSKGAFYFFVFAIAGAAVVALCVMRPWERPHALPIAVEQPAPPPPVVTAPVVTAPVVTAPVVTAPTAPKLAPTVPTIAPTVPKVTRVAAVLAAKPAKKTRAERKHDKHHAAKKHGSAATTTPKATALGASDDPLGGTGL